MRQRETGAAKPCNEAAAKVGNETTRLVEANARQRAELDHLRAENNATKAENFGLRDAARADKVEIDFLRADRESLEALVSELRAAQDHIEVLNGDLKLRNATLETLNKELESFSYAVSHDLRTPLRGIFGFSEALAQSAASKLNDDEANWLKKISAAAVRMDRLTEDLLRLSRITRAQLELNVVDLAEIAREVVEELRQANPGRNVATSIPECLPVKADAVLMRVVISNLLENAWKYTGRRDQAIIVISERAGDGLTEFCVHDNGAGFDMAYAAKLFAPFQRLHSVREFPGSGIGLACVARVIHKHGGTVWAEARPGEGAAFFFTLPNKADVAGGAGRTL